MIGGTFEYLMSSLPHLSFQNTDEGNERIIGLLTKYAESKEVSSPVEILDKEAQKFLSPEAFSTFKQTNLRTIHREEFRIHENSVIADFSAFTHNLKKEIGAFRKGKNSKGHKSTKSKIIKLIGEGTPLDKEIQFMQHQWNALEDLSAGHFADFESLLIYKFKLLILQRWWSFETEPGYKKYTLMTTRVAHGS